MPTGRCDMDEDFYVCRAEFENDTLLWNDEFQAWKTVEDAKTRERILIEELEDFEIPY